jgi:hypothetical protein
MVVLKIWKNRIDHFFFLSFFLSSSSASPFLFSFFFFFFFFFFLDQRLAFENNKIRFRNN